MVRAGEIAADAAQTQAAHKLDNVAQALLTRRRVRGLYIHGDVGRGKSMLMDLFFAHIDLEKKRRVHFHEFMQETHEHIFEWRQKQKQKHKIRALFTRAAGDPIPPVARFISRQTRLLCFDEFQVKDIADASILGRLFAQFWQRNMVVVMTSNQPPDALYAGGLNRHRFLPFIDMLKQHTDSVHLKANRDYRMGHIDGQTSWFTPLGAGARAHLDACFTQFSKRAAHAPIHLRVKGRRFAISHAAGGVARMTFTDLCGTPRGAVDYLALAQTIHTLIIDDIRQMAPQDRNIAMRFITLIDALYEHKVRLIASATHRPADLYPQGDDVVAFQRTISRLNEMQSRAYLEQTPVKLPKN